MCNSVFQCSLDSQCFDGVCQSTEKRFYHSLSLDIVTFLVIVCCLILFMISILLGLGLYLLRRQRWRKHYQPPLETIRTTTTKQPAATVPTASDYDNVVYRAFRSNVQVSSSDDNDSSAMTTSENGSYEPKIVFLGGEQQLTAIFA